MRCTLLIVSLMGAGLPGFAQSPRTAADQQKSRAYYEDGWKDLAGESYDDAVRHFAEAADLDPSSKLAFYGLGRARMGLKQFPAAIKAYEIARDLYTSQVADTYANVAEADRIRQDDQRALQAAITQLGSKGTSSSNSAQLLAMRQALQRTQVKRDTLKDVNISNSVPAFVSVALGSAYFRAERMADAERAYREAVAADPRTGEAWNNLAVVYLETSRYDDAEAAVRAAEKAGYKVNESLKGDIRRKRNGGL